MWCESCNQPLDYDGVPEDYDGPLECRDCRLMFGVPVDMDGEPFQDWLDVSEDDGNDEY